MNILSGVSASMHNTQRPNVTSGLAWPTFRHLVPETPEKTWIYCLELRDLLSDRSGVRRNATEPASQYTHILAGKVLAKKPDQPFSRGHTLRLSLASGWSEF
jgi:hypothetical protein